MDADVLVEGLQRLEIANAKPKHMALANDRSRRTAG